MFRIDVPSAVPALPTPQAAGTPGYFGRGNVGTGELPTTVTADFLNMIQEEIAHVVTGAGLTLSKTDHTQLATAIADMISGSVGGAGFVHIAGDTMTGPLITEASGSGGAGFNLPPGTPPSSPVNGDLWATAAGIFARIAGVTLQLGTLRITSMSIGTNGYIALNDGTMVNNLLIQWCQVPSNVGAVSYSWPITFPHAVFVAVPGGMVGIPGSGSYSPYLQNVTTSGGQTVGNNGGSYSSTIAIIAIGN